MDGVLFVHVTVKIMDKKTISILKVEWNKLKHKLKLAGYKHVHTYSSTPKFYKIFSGYKFLGTMVFEEKEYEVLQWVLNS